MPIAPGNKALISVIYFFLIITGLLIAFQFLIPGRAVNYRVVHIGNLLLFIVGLFSVQMTVRALTDKNTQVFLRMMYGSFLLKFFVFAIAAFIYINAFKKDLNKPALFACLALYILYTIVEVRAALKQSKKTNA